MLRCMNDVHQFRGAAEYRHCSAIGHFVSPLQFEWTNAEFGLSLLTFISAVH